ncbi:MAG: hypothetical protein U0175_15000 [Caldilineaceae bacterium]
MDKTKPGPSIRYHPLSGVWEADVNHAWAVGEDEADLAIWDGMVWEMIGISPRGLYCRHLGNGHQPHLGSRQHRRNPELGWGRMAITELHHDRQLCGIAGTDANHAWAVGEGTTQS